MKNLKIDINADMAEGFDLYDEKGKSLIMPYISMINIACGYHAGSEVLMDKTVKAAIHHQLKIGAHPGYPDKKGFGRLPMALPLEALRSQQLYQIGALREIVRYHGGLLHHVKPHGALYHLAMQDRVVAQMFAEVVASIDSNVKLVGMAGSELMEAAKKKGVAFQCEIFADRRYTESGQLLPRSEEGAIITDISEGLQQIMRLIEDAHTVDTICVHGDNEASIAFARAIYQLEELQEKEYGSK